MIVNISMAVASMRLVEINGQPGALFLDADGVPVLAVSLDIADDLVQTLHAVSDPDKLRHLSVGGDARLATSAARSAPEHRPA